MYDLTGREWAAIVPLLVLMVWMGTFTQSFMPAISAQNARILEQTQTLKVERVRNQGPGDRPLPLLRGSGGQGPGEKQIPHSARDDRGWVTRTLVAPLGMTLGTGSAEPAKIEVARAR
jgi:hypothetical protein